MGVVRLFLVTTSLPRKLPPDLVAATTVILFWPEVGGVEELLLDRLLWKQNSKTAEEMAQLRKVSYSTFPLLKLYYFIILMVCRRSMDSVER